MINLLDEVLLLDRILSNCLLQQLNFVLQSLNLIIFGFVDFIDLFFIIRSYVIKFSLNTLKFGELLTLLFNEVYLFVNLSLLLLHLFCEGLLFSPGLSIFSRKLLISFLGVYVLGHEDIVLLLNVLYLFSNLLFII